jgi:ring-1,2-phenylacetyl-CoA epoxidase subunit PaaD
VQPIRFVPRTLACPRCGSENTEQLSRFGATACKALYRCCGCGEPFEYFKPI